MDLPIKYRGWVAINGDVAFIRQLNIVPIPMDVQSDVV
jgi:hypothetical protein